MFCKVCNTRLNPGARTCPNCGNEAGPEQAMSPRSTRASRLPSPDLSTAREPEEDEVEIALDDITGEDLAPPKPSPEPRAAAKKGPPGSKSGTAPLFAPDVAGLRALLVEQPDALEPGLGIFRADDGTPMGAEYSTGVGDIDLLATDAGGNLVVVMISEKGQGEELVAEVLQRVGWVRKHLGEGNKGVRGIVLCEEPPEGLSYAAAAVSDTIRFKTYRVALTFDDIDV